MLASKKLSQSSASIDESKNTSRFLTFFLGARLFAINILVIKEILEYDQITDIPKMPDFIRGAINLRGKIIPVVDLSIRLGYEKTAITNRSCIVVVELYIDDQAFNVGVVVDTVNRVMDLVADQLEEAPSFGGRINTDYIEGMGKVNNHFVVILDVQNVLSMDDLNMLQACITNQDEEYQEAESA